MTIEQGNPSFGERERHDEDNCIFFATLDYVHDQFGLELSREDFERFLRGKISLGSRSGVSNPKIPRAIDSILKPHGAVVSSILFRIGLKEHYRSQLTFKHSMELLEAERFLRDTRVVESGYWEFPFMGLLSGKGDVDHL